MRAAMMRSTVAVFGRAIDEARRHGAKSRLDKRAAEIDRDSSGLPVGVFMRFRGLDGTV